MIQHETLFPRRTLKLNTKSIRVPRNDQTFDGKGKSSGKACMVGEMVQNSQSLYSFTFNALIDIYEYIYSHSTTEFTFKKYIYSHLPVYFLFTIIFAHIYEMSSFTFNELYPVTFTIEIFIQHFLRITFAHQYKIRTAEYGLRTTDWV